MDTEPDNLILLVTGAHLRAEAADRPTAYRLRERLNHWLDRGHSQGRPHILVCSDLWYLNNDHLRALPTISIGGPRVNALTAFLADKLPSAFAIEDVLLIQLDLDFVDIIAACWGHNADATSAAVDAFHERYLDSFMHAAIE